jgi:hypothetical protein
LVLGGAAWDQEAVQIPKTSFPGLRISAPCPLAAPMHSETSRQRQRIFADKAAVLWAVWGLLFLLIASVVMGMRRNAKR